MARAEICAMCNGSRNRAVLPHLHARAGGAERLLGHERRGGHEQCDKDRNAGREQRLVSVDARQGMNHPALRYLYRHVAPRTYRNPGTSTRKDSVTMALLAPDIRLQFDRAIAARARA